MSKLYPLVIAIVAMVLTSFITDDYRNAVVTVKARSQSKVVLTWAPVKAEVSHYVIERSVNGRAYYEAGIVFTGENETEPSYLFTDNLRMNYGGALYYRLRVVMRDNSELVSGVTTLRRLGGVNPLTH